MHTWCAYIRLVGDARQLNAPDALACLRSEGVNFIGWSGEGQPQEFSLTLITVEASSEQLARARALDGVRRALAVCGLDLQPQIRSFNEGPCAQGARAERVE